MDYKFDVLDFVQRYIKKQNNLYNHTYRVYDPPVWEYLVDSKVKTYISQDEVPEMIFIYFTVHEEVNGQNYKRYYQLVTGAFGLEIYFQDENVIDINRNHPLSDVRFKFTNWCRHMLKKLD
jgi:hypothetical protein